MTTEEMALIDIRDKLREVQRICENGGEAAPTTFVDVIELARESFEMKQKNATANSRQTSLEARLVEIRAAGHTMRGQITATEDRIKTLKALLTGA